MYAGDFQGLILEFVACSGHFMHCSLLCVGCFRIMDSRKGKSSCRASSLNVAHLSVSNKVDQMVAPPGDVGAVQTDVDIDLREVYFLIMHFLSAGPCRRTFLHFKEELLEHQLLPRRYHAWFSRSGDLGGDDAEEDDDGFSLPLDYSNLVGRYFFALYLMVLFPFYYHM